jgi:uncharacterized protein YkwD
MKQTFRISATVLASAVMAIVLCSTMFGHTMFGDTVDLRGQRELFASINRARLAHGLNPLRWDQALAAAAKRHAEVMAEHGSVQHVFDGEPSLSARVKRTGTHFHWLAENVTQGPSPGFIHDQFMGSKPHRANILDRDMDSVGIGIVERHRQLFAVEDFSQAR